MYSEPVARLCPSAQKVPFSFAEELANSLKFSVSQCSGPARHHAIERMSFQFHAGTKRCPVGVVIGHTEILKVVQKNAMALRRYRTWYRQKGHLAGRCRPLPRAFPSLHVDD